MIRKSGGRFSLATNAERVCAEIMLKDIWRRTADVSIIRYRATTSQTPSGCYVPASLPSNQDRLFPWRSSGRAVGGGTNVIFAKPTTDSRRNVARRACTRSGRPIRPAYWQTAHEAVDKFSLSLPLRGKTAGERPAVAWQADVAHPCPVLYCGSHRCRRNAWLAVLRRRRKGPAGS